MYMTRSLKSIIPQLKSLYACYNRREYVSPDPLQFLYDYPDLRDREIAGMIASALAYGGVKQILGSVSRVLEKMRPSPYLFLMSRNLSDLRKGLEGFKHRFTTGDDLAQMLWGIKRAIEDYGSLEACFTQGSGDQTILPALTAFVRRLRGYAEQDYKFLLPHPVQQSACKRLNLYLRWMVRKDEVDPGGWDRVPRSKLIVPIDLHMHRIGRALGITERRQADLKTALEITSAFREIAPDDPVKYDFVLTRLGIRDDMDMEGFLRTCRLPEVARGDS